MKRLILVCLISLAGFANSAMGSLCSDPLKGELCYNMHYLRSQVMALGAQRELMQVNYPYMNSIAQEITDITRYLSDGRLIGAEHRAGIEVVMNHAQTLALQAKNQDPAAMSAASMIQKKCATCHSSSASAPGGIGWSDIFANDWDNITKNCSKEGRNPYLCRSMNGMMSAYSGIFEGSQLGRKNFKAVELSAAEVARIAGDLRDKRMVHGSDVMFGEVFLKAKEVEQLALESRPEAFEKGVLITSSCMQCHGNNIFSNKTALLKVF